MDGVGGGPRCLALALAPAPDGVGVGGGWRLPFACGACRPRLRALMRLAAACAGAARGGFMLVAASSLEPAALLGGKAWSGLLPPDGIPRALLLSLRAVRADLSPSFVVAVVVVDGRVALVAPVLPLAHMSSRFDGSDDLPASSPGRSAPEEDDARLPLSRASAGAKSGAEG